MTLIDKAEAHDNDLIRRGDVLREIANEGLHILDAAIAALPARGVWVPDGWHMERLSRGNGFLFYTLRQDGWRKGEPIMVNDVTVRLEPAPGSETDLEPIAARILAALAPTPGATEKGGDAFEDRDSDRPNPATSPGVTAGADAAQAREAAQVIAKNGAEATAAAMILHIAETLRAKGKAVLTTGDDFGAQVLQYADAIGEART